MVAYVVEASVKEGRPHLHRVTAGVHCNLVVNPRTVEAQVQGAAVMGVSMCLAGSAITLKDSVIEQGNFGDFTVARITDTPAFEVHIVPSADPPTGMGEPGLPPLAPAFANAIARLTGKPQRQRGGAKQGRARHGRPCRSLAWTACQWRHRNASPPGQWASLPLTRVARMRSPSC
ncbi:4-hydroxybenzoyl-CoA reductase, alpha subunit [compost metagenome]